MLRNQFVTDQILLQYQLVIVITMILIKFYTWIITKKDLVIPRMNLKKMFVRMKQELGVKTFHILFKNMHESKIKSITINSFFHSRRTGNYSISQFHKY